MDKPIKDPGWEFQLGEFVRKVKGGSWRGPIVGFYSTEITARGYVVESYFEKCSVQCWPEAALELWINPHV